MKFTHLGLAAILAVLPLGPARAQEDEVDQATRTRVLEAIEAYVQEDQTLKGKFLVLDPRSDEPLALSFDHVHSGVKPHEEGYRACVDFKDASGIVYDVDVVVSAAEEPAVRQVFVHKVAGEAVEASGK